MPLRHSLFFNGKFLSSWKQKLPQIELKKVLIKLVKLLEFYLNFYQKEIPFRTLHSILQKKAFLFIEENGN